MIEFSKPWKDCPSCHKEYQNELRVDIATEFVSFVRRQYPKNTQSQVEALYWKLAALMNMFIRLQPVQKIEAGVTANVMLSLIDRIRVVAPLTMRYSQMEVFAYNTHGRIALDEGTEESARRAVVHFEKYLKVCETIGDDDNIAIAKRNIAYAKSKYEHGSNEEVLKTYKELYEIRVAKYGEKHEYTIIAGKNYAGELQRASRCDEARELLMKLLATSKQVLGPLHNTTKDIERILNQCSNAQRANTHNSM
jgi:hypothetical protein